MKTEDTYNLSTTPKYASEVGYKWMLQAEDYKDAATVDVRANNAVARLVALPDGWDTALRCLGLEKLAMEYAKDVAQKERHLTEVHCSVLEDHDLTIGMKMAWSSLSPSPWMTTAW